MEAALEVEPLTALDRCDRCGAQAYVRVYMTSGTLLFCGHHSNAHWPELKAAGVFIHDETRLLTV